MSSHTFRGFLKVFLLLYQSQSLLTTDLPFTTNKGVVIGLRHDPHPSSRVSYDAFLGIPYGDVPSRFQLAEPRRPWSEPLLTQKEGPPCPQPKANFQEDCLFLNVFTPLNSSGEPGRFPVMVFIHGARFTMGSSQPDRYGPDFLVNDGVILVSMNFRLGASGFLTLGSAVAPGNMGLHDTLLALQWVQDEISAFGGDPSRVTLFGYSSGSIMTQMHYLSPLTSDLFAGIIAESGSALADWGHYSSEEGTRRAKVLAQAVNCDPTLDDPAILACLQAANMQDIVDNQFVDGIITENDKISGNSRVFLPVLDTQLTAKRPFFNESLENLMAKALELHRPMITGINTEEGILKMIEYNFWKSAESNLEAFIPRRVRALLNSEEKAAAAESIRDRYFSHSTKLNKAEMLVDLYTDSAYGYPSIQMSRYFANVTYGYLFAFMGAWSRTKWRFSNYTVYGVNHGNEIAYLFYHNILSLQDTAPSLLNMANIKIRDQMVKWWTTFAKTGVPDTSWPTVTEGGYLLIDKSLATISSSAFENRYYNFWADMEQST